MVQAGFCYIGSDKDCMVDVGDISFVSQSRVEEFNTCITFHSGSKIYTTRTPQEVIKDILNIENRIA